MKININLTVCCIESEGPGRRYTIWVQGCDRHCKGCGNSYMWSTEPNHLVDCDEIFEKILKSREFGQIEGITIVGGEPMLQARSLAYLAKKCQKEGLSVIVFTGYTLKGLKKANLDGIDDLLSYTDVLVDGPYIENKPEKERNWVGSSNQKFHFLTNRYKPGIEFPKDKEKRIASTDFLPVCTVPVVDYGRQLYSVIESPEEEEEDYYFYNYYYGGYSY